MCTSDHGAPAPPLYPRALEAAFPANGIFVSGFMVQRGTMQLTLALDTEASVQLAQDVRRPVEPLVPGDVLQVVSIGTSPCAEDECTSYRIHIGEADTVAPAMPQVTARTLLVRDPDEPGPFSCGDVDVLELTIDASDDVAPRGQLGFVAYIAPTEAELAATTDPAIAFGYDRVAPGDEATASIYLGASAGRERDGSPFLSRDPFCFQLAAYDRAGNLSARSTATCLDTTDESDPSVVFVESSAGCCASSGAASGDWLAIVLVALALGGRGRAIRRPPRAQGNGPG